MLGSGRRDWEDVSALDPYWAILSDPARRFGRWDREDFLQTGTDTIEQLLGDGARHGLPTGRKDALDFGCGAGRLALPLAGHFERCLGLDISAQMVEKARANAGEVANCCFAVHDAANLASLETSSFDLVVSYLVLQHIVAAEAKAQLIAEFVRVLRPRGLLAFQLPSHISAWRLVQPSPRLYRFLRRVGAPPALLYDRLHLHPIRVSSLKCSRVLEIIDANGGRTLDVKGRSVAAGVISSDYLVTKEA